MQSNELAPIKEINGALYETLGIKKTASESEIRAAWRKIAKELHPDVNGGKESPEFSKARQAYDILINPHSRKLYDAFGIAPDNDDAMMKLQAFQGLGSVFNMVLEKVNAADLARVDIMGTMRKFIADQIGKDDADIAAFSRDEGKLRDQRAVMLKRSSCKKDGAPNFFIQAIDKNIESLIAQRAPYEAARKIRKLMIELLDDYGFDFDTTPLPSQHWASTSSFTGFP